MKRTLIQKMGLLGIVERFSVFAVTGFNAALGIHLFCMNTDKNQSNDKGN